MDRLLISCTSHAPRLWSRDTCTDGVQVWVLRSLCKELCGACTSAPVDRGLNRHMAAAAALTADVPRTRNAAECETAAATLNRALIVDASSVSGRGWETPPPSFSCALGVYLVVKSCDCTAAASAVNRAIDRHGSRPGPDSWCAHCRGPHTKTPGRAAFACGPLAGAGDSTDMTYIAVYPGNVAQLARRWRNISEYKGSLYISGQATIACWCIRLLLFLLLLLLLLLLFFFVFSSCSLPGCYGSTSA